VTTVYFFAQEISIILKEVYRMDKQQGPTYGTGNYIQYPVIYHNVNECEKEYTYIYICVCVCVCVCVCILNKWLIYSEENGA